MSRIPDPNALRRDRKDDASWTVLDPKGKVKKVPSWPLVEPSERELELWDAIWKRPQSILWEQNSQEIEVALYIRRLGEVELKDAGASLNTLLIRQMESLLLTTSSMYRAKVKMGDQTVKPNSVKRIGSKHNDSAQMRYRRLGQSIPCSLLIHGSTLSQ